MLLHSLDRWEMAGIRAIPLKSFDVLAAIDGNGAVGVVTELAIGLTVRLWKFIHHDATVLAIGNLAHERWHLDIAELLAFAAQCFVIGLHLSNELCVRSLGLDQRRDAGFVSLTVPGKKLIGNKTLAALQWGAVQALDAVLLDQKPLIARVL